MRADRSQVGDGGRVRYTLSVTATGSADETDVALSDPSPINGVLDKTTATCGAIATCSIAIEGSTLVWHFGTLAAAQTVSVSVQARAKATQVTTSGCPNTMLRNSVSASSLAAATVHASASSTVLCTDVLGEKTTKKQYTKPTSLPPAVGEPVSTRVLGFKVERTATGGSKVVRGAKFLRGDDSQSTDQQAVPTLPSIRPADHSSKLLWIVLAGVLAAVVLGVGVAAKLFSRSATG